MNRCTYRIFYITIVDYLKKTIYDMQNEKDYLIIYKVFDLYSGFCDSFLKIDDALMVFGVLDKNVFLFGIAY